MLPSAIKTHFPLSRYLSLLIAQKRILYGMEQQADTVRVGGAKITEEVLNSAAHGLGAIVALCGLLYGLSGFSGSASSRAGFITYAVSLFLLMLFSCLYHALYFSKAKRVFQIFDHSAIFLLIAGSYTPFILYLYSGWSLFLACVFVWVFAITGVVMKSTMPHLSKKTWGRALYRIRLVRCFTFTKI